MLNYTLFSNEMQIFDIIAEDEGDAEKQLTMFAVSLTRHNGSYKITHVMNEVHLRVYGSFTFVLTYELIKQ